MLRDWQSSDCLSELSDWCTRLKSEYNPWWVHLSTMVFWPLLCTWHGTNHGVIIRLEAAWRHPQPGWLEACETGKNPSGRHYSSMDSEHAGSQPRRLYILCWRELSRRRLPAVSPAAGHFTAPTVAGLPCLCENFRPTTSKSSPI